MLHATTTLDGETVGSNAFQSSLGLFIFCLRLVS